MSDLGVFLGVSHPKRIKRNYSVTKRTYSEICVYCGGIGDTIDHVLPFTLYVDHSRANLVTACQSCNSIAGAKVFQTFDEKRDFIRQRRTELGYPTIPDKSDIEDKGWETDEPWIIDAIWEELPEASENWDDSDNYDDSDSFRCEGVTYKGKRCKLDKSECAFHGPTVIRLNLLGEPI